MRENLLCCSFCHWSRHWRLQAALPGPGRITTWIRPKWISSISWRHHLLLTRTEGKADLQAGSATVSCSGEHKCRGDNCSYDCHLQGHAIPAPMLLTAAQEIRFESFINQAFRVKVE
jgi:hypothetical protein